MEELEHEIMEILQQNKLPLEAKRYILKHIFTILDSGYNMALLKEKEVKNSE